ncbi:MAG: hypothetical protein V1886_01105 [archaeon]
MAETDKIYESKVKFEGLFDFKALYNFVSKWLSTYGYGIIEEKSYTEKIKAEGKELEVIWSAKKSVSDYFMFQFKIIFRVFGMSSVEVQRGDIKIKLNKGSLEVGTVGLLLKDYESRWESSPFTKFMRGVYDRYIIKSRIGSYEGKIMEEVDELCAQLKSYLEMEGKRF